MNHLNITNNRLYTILLLSIVLFFPVKLFVEYHVILILFLLSSLIFIRRSYKIDNSLLLIGVFLIFLMISFTSLYSSIIFHNDVYRNLSEIIRFIPILLLLSTFKSISLNQIIVRNILLVYIVFVAFICFAQINKLSFANVFTDIYSAKHHIEGSLDISNRALGLSTGPGDNAIIALVIYAYFLAIFYTAPSKKIMFIAIVSLFLCVYIILLSQSQTGFIVLSLLTTYGIALNIMLPFSKNSRKRSIFLFFMFCVIVIPVIIKYIDELRYLISLFDYGLERNSYQRREIKVAETLALISENSVLFLFGHGKDYIPDSAALDNEYMFFLSVYGFGVTFIIILLYIYILIKPFFKRYRTPELLVVNLTIFTGVILAWPSSFLLEPRALMLLAVFISMYLHSERIRKT